MEKLTERVCDDNGRELYCVLPCPFCGSYNLIIRYESGYSFVYCQDCKCEGSKTKMTEDYIGAFWSNPAVQRAADKWNTRAKEPKSDDYVLI